MNDPIARISKAVTAYYKQLREEATQEDFNQWIESLEEPMKTSFKNEGLDKSKGVLNFQRFILEKKGKGMDEYLKRELSEEDFKYWK